MSDVRAWLEKQGLGQYAEAFAANDVDMSLLPKLTADDVRDIGVASVGHRRRLLEAIAALAVEGSQEVAASQSGRLPPSSKSNPGTSAERRQITVMFCDLVGSTALSEALDPEDLREVMAAYQNAAGAVITRYDGHVAQYLGDGLMTYFGWPTAHEDDAERAVRAGLEIVEAAKTVAALSPLQVRVGVATGPVVVGETGAGDASVPKHAVGETPNLAARLQGLAKPDEIVIGPSTRRLIAGTFDLEDRGEAALKGIALPVPTWRVVRVGQREGRFSARVSQLTPFVGRQSEIAMLLERWQQASEGQGQVVLLYGEAGIGKSRSLRELSERVTGVRHRRMHFQCSPYHTSAAFHPLIAEVERQAGFDVADCPAERLNKLQAYVRGLHMPPPDITTALFAQLLSIETDSPDLRLDIPPHLQRPAMIEALGAQAVRLSQAEPVLALFEDVHWIDPSSLETLDIMARTAAQHRVLLVITCRPEFAHRWTEFDHVGVLTLNRLGHIQAGKLIAKMSDNGNIPAALVDQIVAKTDGVPLFLEELTKSVIEKRSAADADGGDGAHYDGLQIVIPSTLQDSLMARLDRLDTDDKRRLQVAAVIGRDFPGALLSAVLNEDDSTTRLRLGALAASGFLVENALAPQAQYSFKHALIRDAAYDSLLRQQRRKWHQSVLTEMATWPDASQQASVLARHAIEAGDWEGAVEHGWLAGRLAFAQGANTEAAEAFGLAMDAAAQLPEGRDRTLKEIDLALDLQPVLFALGRHDLWPGQVEGAEEKAEALQETERLALARNFLITFNWVIGNYQRGIEYGEWCVAVPKTEENFSRHIASHFLLGLCYHASGDHARALWAEKYVIDNLHGDAELGMHTVSGVVSSFARGYLADTLASLGEFDEGRQLAEKGVMLGARVQHPFSIVVPRWGLGMLAFREGRFEEAVQHLETGLRVAEEGAVYPALSLILSALAAAYARLGQAERAVATADRALDADVFGVAYGGHGIVPVLASEAFLKAGARERAEDAARQGLELCRTRGEHGHEGWAHLALARALIAGGDESNANEHLLQAREIAKRHGLNPLVSACQNPTG